LDFYGQTTCINAGKSKNKTAAVCLVRVLALLSGGVKFQLNERKFTNLRLRQRKEMRVVYKAQGLTKYAAKP